MSLRTYMRNHQSCEILSIHFVIMWILIPIYVVDYNLNTEYYESGKDESDRHKTQGKCIRNCV